MALRNLLRMLTLGIVVAHGSIEISFMEGLNVNSGPIENEIVLRNLHPFITVASEEKSNDERKNKIRCATGPFGTLETWQQYFDPNTSTPYYYNEDTKISEWERPCTAFPPHVPQIDLKQRIRMKFQVTERTIDGSAPQQEQNWEGSVVDGGIREDITGQLSSAMISSAEDGASPATITELTKSGQIKHSADTEAKLDEMFNFDGELDELHGIKVRDHYPTLPVDKSYTERKGLGDLDTVHSTLAELVKSAESEIAVLGNWPPTVDNSFLAGPEGLKSRLALSAGWTDLGSLWIAKGNTTRAMNCFRRAIFWHSKYVAALLNVAVVLSQFGFKDDACTVVYLIQTRGDPQSLDSKHVSTTLKTFFNEQCLQQSSSWLNKIFLSICAGALLIFAISHFAFSNGGRIETVDDDKKVKSSTYRKNLKNRKKY